VPSKSHSTSVVEALDQLRDDVVDGPGQLDRSVRQAAFSGEGVPAAAAGYVEKVREHAYRVVDGDIDALKKAGWSDDAIFELTVSAALGAALSRREKAMKAMGR
jgi:alkylhydroperoxidase family enzyme